MPLSDEEILTLYKAFREDPKNIEFRDDYFCSVNHTSLDRLRGLLEKNPQVIKEIDSREVTDTELTTLLGLLTRLCYKKAFSEKIASKSLEGLVNAIVGLMKQRGLESGRPTEIIKYEELEKKTPQQLHDWVIAEIRGSHASRN